MRLRTPAPGLSGLVLALSAAAGCGVFTPVGDATKQRLDVEWARRLYDLEMFAYHPSEEARALFVRSDATPEHGLLVVPTKDRRVLGLDARDGRTVWELTTRGPNAAQPVAIGDDDALVASMDGHVYRIAVRNGRIRWTSDHPGQAMTAPPVVSRGADPAKARIFVTSADGRITALSADKGERLWEQTRPAETELTMAGAAGATLVGDNVVTGFADGTVVAYAQLDGATTWSTDLSGGGKKDFADVDTTPVWVPAVADATKPGAAPVGAGVVVVGSFRRGLFGLAADGGDIAWSIKGEGFQSPVLDDGVLYVAQASGRVWAIEGDSGHVRWVSDVGEKWAGVPALSRKYLFVPAGLAMTVLERGSGHTIMKWDDGRGVRATPELAFGTLYVFGNSGAFYAMGVY